MKAIKIAHQPRRAKMGNVFFAGPEQAMNHVLISCRQSDRGGRTWAALNKSKSRNWESGNAEIESPGGGERERFAFLSILRTGPKSGNLKLDNSAAQEHARGVHSLADMAPRHAAIRRAVNPLPGSQPRNHFKPINIPGDCDGLTLLAALERMVWNVSAADWQAEFVRGRIVTWEQQPGAPTQIVRAGQRYQHLFPNVTEPEVNGAVEILHEDEALIVVNKPAPLPMHAGGRYYLNTLQHILNAVYHPQQPYPAHRLDAHTTGLVLVARTRQLAGQLQTQFAQGQVQKTYFARVSGQLPADEFYCDAPISAGAGEQCSRTVDLANGLAARTEFRVIRRDADGTNLLKVRPLTGRTNQIRVHLWHLGVPVCGDTVYLPGQQLGHTPSPAVGDPPLCLHAAWVRFLHPLSREPVEFTAPLPAWAK